MTGTTTSLVLADYVAGTTRTLEHLTGPTRTLTGAVSRIGAVVDLVRAHDDQAGYNAGAFVIPADPTRPARPVRNLGWLLAHRADLSHPMVGVAFTVATWRYGKRTAPVGSWGYSPIDGRPHVGPLPVEAFAAPILLAHLEDGRTYATAWADGSVLHQWLDRPSFQGYLVDWNGRGMSAPTCPIGGADYAALAEHARQPNVHPSKRAQVAA